jgi:acyl carrier protein
VGLDTVELILAIEDAFEIGIPNEAAGHLVTVGDVHRFVVATLRRRDGPAVDENAIYAKVHRVICEQSGARPERVHPDTRFVEDLGMD